MSKMCAELDRRPILEKLNAYPCDCYQMLGIINPTVLDKTNIQMPPTLHFEIRCSLRQVNTSLGSLCTPPVRGKCGKCVEKHGVMSVECGNCRHW